MMKVNQRNLSLNVLTLAVRGALAATAVIPLAAMADDEPTVADQINPTNYVEIGAGVTSTGSAKFGEYNGLNKNGATVIGNFSVKGGDSYAQGLGTKRWSIIGTDLGTTSREFSADMSDQGKWSLGIGFDQLRHHITDSYQTPYQGSMGGNLFTLPTTDGMINTSGSGTRNLSSWHGTFNTQDVYSERQNTSLSAGYNFNRQWDFKFDYKHIDQTGAKLIGAATDASSLDAIAWGGERIVTLMNPTKYQTDNFNFAVNWKGDSSYFTAGYYGSLFHDDYSGVSWSNPFQTTSATGTAPGPNGFPLDTMSTPPSNQFHQLNLTGGYIFSDKTRVVGGLSYARNTQNESYTGTFTPGAYTSGPASLDGRVTIKHADMTLTHQATSALSLTAGVKYNERDNHTASYQYVFKDLGGNTDTATNTPESYRHTQFELAGDYRISAKQHLHAGYEYDDMKRWCESALANTATGATPSYNTVASCVQVPQNKDNKLGVDYRLRVNDTVIFKAGYAYSNRTADVNSSFYNPMQSSFNGEGYENYGYLAFFDASRKENQVKLAVNWQATEKLNFDLSGKYAKDDYDTLLGVQQGTTSSVNLDAAYSFTDNASVDAFVTTQHRTRDLTSDNGRNTTALTANIWSNNLTDDELTLGIGGKQKGLMSDKLELSEDLTYSLGKTDYSTGLNYTSASCTATSNLSCGPLPTIKSEMLQFKLTGSYKLDKVSSVTLGYLYQHLSSNDYYYNIYQYGYTPSTLLPTNQVAPSYNQNVVFATYRYNFK